MSNLFDVTLTPADLPQAPQPAASPAGGASGADLYFYGPGASGAHASPQPNAHAEIAPVFGGEGPG